MAEPRPITAESLSELARAGSLRTVRAVQTGDKWAVEAEIGMETRPMRSQRDPVRQFARLDTLQRFLDAQGIRKFEVVAQ